MAQGDYRSVQRLVRPGVLGGGADVRQHVARFDRGQLIAVAEQDQTRPGRDRRDQFCHQREVDHRCFVHDHDIGVQRALGIMLKIRRAGQVAEQAMNRGRGKFLVNGANRFR